MNEKPFQHLFPFAEKSISIEGNKLAYVDEGEGENILMLHGNPTWSFFYRDLIHGLKDSHRCVAVDHMGCGRSDTPQDFAYTLETRIENVLQLVSELSLEKITLIVHDWGGAIGFGLARRIPEKIKRIVILNTAAFSDTVIPFRIAVCRWPLLGRFLLQGLNAFSRTALFMAVNPNRKLKPEVKAGFLAPYHNWSERRAVFEFVQDIPMEKNHPSRELLLEIEKDLKLFNATPKLILWGGLDFCFNKHFYERWLKIFPNAEKHYFEDAGHYLLEDAGEACLNRVKDFLVRS